MRHPRLILVLGFLLVFRYYRFAEAPPLATVAPVEHGPRMEAALEHQAKKSPEDTLERYVREASRTYAVPVALIRAVIRVESAGNARAVSPKGARGLMQLMPQTAAALDVRDPFDPRDNILAGTRYLRFLLDAFDGDVALSLAAYNAGHDAVVRYRGVPPYSETHDYLSRIAWQLDLEVEASP